MKNKLVYQKEWWKEAIAYQIYVRSFKDTNGDGIGDLKGIIEKIPYLKSLGINAVYLNPINQSPNDDNGYDISDYYDIMDDFGTMDDFNQLLDELHKNDIKLIMDLVINHTSDEHPWFKEAVKSLDNPYRDYYIWKKGKDHLPPNNWTSFFGGSAWEYDDTSKEYYLHIFSRKQPDLNWENEKVRQEICKVIRFWRDKGVDGFRFDAINHLAKDILFDDAKILSDGSLDMMPKIQNLPPVHSHISFIRNECFKEDGTLIIGEAGGISFHNAFEYTHAAKGELHMLFHFDFHSIGRGEKPWQRKPVDVLKIKESFSGWSTRHPDEGWNPIFYSNHDTTRTLSRLVDETKFKVEAAKLLALLQMTMRGTPFIYYGDEIGMENPNDFALEDFKDVAVKNEYKLQVKEGKVDEENFIKGMNYTNRDNSRTPMQWSNEEISGFTKGTPWLKVNKDYPIKNVEKQEANPNSILNFYKKIISTRKSEPILVYGSFIEHFKKDDSVYIYERFDAKGFGIEDETKFLIICNMKGTQKSLELTPVLISYIKNGILLLSNYNKTDNPTQYNFEEPIMLLRPYEALLFKLEQ